MLEYLEGSELGVGGNVLIVECKGLNTIRVWGEALSYNDVRVRAV